MNDTISSHSAKKQGCETLTRFNASQHSTIRLILGLLLCVLVSDRHNCFRSIRAALALVCFQKWQGVNYDTTRNSRISPLTCWSVSYTELACQVTQLPQTLRLWGSICENGLEYY